MKRIGNLFFLLIFTTIFVNEGFKSDHVCSQAQLHNSYYLCCQQNGFHIKISIGLAFICVLLAGKLAI
jgi:hypothetical protein